MPNSTIVVRVASKRLEALDIYRFELVSADGQALPSFTAGAHIDVHVADGYTRQYSLCNPVSEHQHYVLGVLRDPASRGGSIRMHDQVKEGDTLTISQPRNQFPLEKSAVRSILLAGGIGVTPIICMADSLAAANADFAMHYCTRSSNRTAFAARLREASYAGKIAFHFDDGPKEQRLDIAALLAHPQPGVHVYFCGPTGFLDVIVKAAQSAGWPEGQIHHESFVGGTRAVAGDESFEVVINSSGKVVVVAPNQSVVKALALVGVEIPTDCEQGICGTCLTPVISGIPDHRDVYQTAAAKALNDQFTPCCSRSKSPRLVLDL